VTLLAVVLLAVAVAVCVYAYVGYPLFLKVLTPYRPLRSGKGGRPESPRTWPRISIVLPAHNEAESIHATLERIVAIDYPRDRRQILVVSDASTDATDHIVLGFGQGVELLRQPVRSGKTAAENAARAHLTGDIIINTDASVRIDAAAVKHLVAALDDPSVGVASGRDMSVSNLDTRANPGEQAYVGYDMWVRDLETRVYGIVGASGCLYAIRRDLHLYEMPEGLSRDFGSALVARRQGYRAVSVPEAICYVPRISSLKREYRRKVRTIARGLRTLWYMRALLNPRRYGVFAWMLWSHKIARWLVPWMAVLAGVALAVLAPGNAWAGLAIAGGAAALLVAAIGWLWPEGRPLPRPVSMLAYGVSGNIAALRAWLTAMGRQHTALWEPTRRGPVAAPPHP